MKQWCAVSNQLLEFRTITYLTHERFQSVTGWPAASFTSSLKQNVTYKNEKDFQSNCLYTFFYYPSSRLPPRTMFEDEVCHFWCMIDDEQKVFFVDASFTWNMEVLRNVIQQWRPCLQSIEITDLGLWKVRVFCSLA